MPIISESPVQIVCSKRLKSRRQSALLILIGTSPGRQLPTIRSRSQDRAVSAAAERNGRGYLARHRRRLRIRTLACAVAELSEGSVERATQLTDPDLWEFRESADCRLCERRDSTACV